jgi:hypothetical protein
MADARCCCCGAGACCSDAGFSDDDDGDAAAAAAAGDRRGWGVRGTYPVTAWPVRAHSLLSCSSITWTLSWIEASLLEEEKRAAQPRASRDVWQPMVGLFFFVVVEKVFSLVLAVAARC